MNHKVTCCFDNRLVLATWHASRKVLFMSRFPFAGTDPESNSLSGSAELDKGIKTTTRHTAKNSGLLPRNLRVSSRISGR